MHRIPPASPENPVEVDRERRLLGFGLGVILGLGYTLASQGINHLALPGVPLYQPPYGLQGNVMVGGLWGGILGLLCAWPYSTAIGVTLASVVHILVQVTRSLAGLDESLGRLLLVAIFLGAPLAFLMMPAMLLLRRATNDLAAARKRKAFWRQLLRAPLLLLLVVMLLGAFSLYQSKERMVLLRMHDLLQAGLTAGAFPEEMRLLDGGAFSISAGYTLEWTETDLDRFIELRPPGNYDEHAAVIARFDTGLILVCLFPTATAPPTCRFRDVPKAMPSRPSFSEDW